MDKRFSSYARDYPVERAMFKLACDMGLEVYNTFGISGVFDETAVDAPVLAFKRWLNGNVEEFIGTYVLPMHPHVASRLGAIS
ncbi:peptidoglycan bridge formation glycyltransferase FemA/FemB family protein [Actinomycetaceae bacterium L2_0104]